MDRTHDPDCIFIRVERARQSLVGLVERALSQRGHHLTGTQGLLLHLLGKEQLRPSDIKQRGFPTHANLSYNITQLIARGYLTQVRHPTDKRSILVQLTQKGSDAHGAIASLLDDECETAAKVGGIPKTSISDTGRTLSQLTTLWDGLMM